MDEFSGTVIAEFADRLECGDTIAPAEIAQYIIERANPGQSVRRVLRQAAREVNTTLVDDSERLGTERSAGVFAHQLLARVGGDPGRGHQVSVDVAYGGASMAATVLAGHYQYEELPDERARSLRKIVIALSDLLRPEGVSLLSEDIRLCVAFALDTDPILGGLDKVAPSGMLVPVLQVAKTLSDDNGPADPKLDYIESLLATLAGVPLSMLPPHPDLALGAVSDLVVVLMLGAATIALGESSDARVLSVVADALFDILPAGEREHVMAHLDEDILSTGDDDGEVGRLLRGNEELAKRLGGDDDGEVGRLLRGNEELAKRLGGTVGSESGL